MSIRVLVIDDSAFMRRAISEMLNDAPGVEVVATGRNGKEGVELAKQHKPDVVTLDIEMPEMDGLTALRHIKRSIETQVLMCSSLTTEGSQESLKALRMGAADVIAKDHSTFSTKMHEMRDDLLRRVRALGEPRRPKLSSSAGLASSKSAAGPTPIRTGAFKVDRPKLVVIGSSTGGPPVLEDILTALPGPPSCPIVVAQHMPEVFTRTMTDRLDKLCSMPVELIEHGCAIRDGVVYIAPGGHHTAVYAAGAAFKAGVSDEPASELFKPSANVLLGSAAQAAKAATVGIILTGIGKDGTDGAKAVRDAGGKVATQSEETCVVYGMPRSVDEAGLSDASMTPAQIGTSLSPICRKAAA